MKVAPIEIPLAKGFYESESLPVSNRLCKNLYPNVPEIEATSKAQLYSTPGLVQMDTTGINNSNRGAIVMAGVPYFVNGNTLWQYARTIDGLGNEIFTLNNLGTIPGNGRVSLATSGIEVCVVVPGTTQAYIYSVSGGFQQITDPNFIPSPAASIVNGVVFASGYFVFHADNGVIFHSQPNDGLSYNAIDFFKYENGKNEVVGLHEYKDQLYVFSNENSAVYAATNINSNGSAFIKIQGYEFSKGLSSQFAVFDFDGSFVMIGQGINESPKIYAFTGNDFQPISHSSIEYLLQRYSSTDISMAFGFNYTFRGGVFAVFSLRNNTFVFDAKVSRLSGELIWHERESIDLADKSRWRVNSLVTAYNRLLCGDSEDGIIGQVDNETYTEYGNKIFREVSLIVPDSNGVMKRHYYAKLEIEPGISPYEVEFIEANSNYILASEEFSKSNWTKQLGSVNHNQISSPLSSDLTADVFTEDSSNGEHVIYQSSQTVPLTGFYTASVYIKANGRNAAYLFIDDGSVISGIEVNLSTGAFTLVNGVVSGAVDTLTNGWYRVSFKRNSIASTTPSFNVMLKETYGGPNSYAGDGVSGAYLFGAQLTKGYLTDYEKTQSTATNIALRSEEFDNATWLKNNVTITNNMIAPDGTATAEKIQRNGVNANDRVFQTGIAINPASTYTVSVHLKNIDALGTSLAFRETAGNLNRVRVNWSGLSVSSVSLDVGSPIDIRAEQLTNNWWRISFSFASTVATGDLEIDVDRLSSTGTESIYAWGAQMEEFELSDYIKTEGAIATRSPSAIVIQQTPASDLNKTAEIELTYSDDGKVFEQYRARKCGERGNYFHDLQWLNLGATRTERVYKLRMSHPVKYVLRKFIVGMA